MVCLLQFFPFFGGGGFVVVTAAFLLCFIVYRFCLFSFSLRICHEFCDLYLFILCVFFFCSLHFTNNFKGKGNGKKTVKLIAKLMWIVWSHQWNWNCYDNSTQSCRRRRSLSQCALTRYFTLSLTIALFFATHSARVLSVRNIDSSLFLSLSLSVWFQVILNKDFANLENLVWTSKRVFCCYIFSPKETAQKFKASSCMLNAHT